MARVRSAIARRRERWRRLRTEGVSARRLAGALLAVTLLAAAFWVALAHGEALQAALSNARRAPLGLVLLAVSLPLANWLLISTSFSVLYGRQTPVAVREMSLLVAAAWLLNYLPLRPGLVARLAYHKRRHGITVRRSIQVLVVSSLLSGLGALLCAGIALLLPASAPVWIMVAGILAPTVPMFAGVRSERLGTLCLAFCLRYLDLLVWVGRYWAVFAVIGVPLSLRESVALAIVSQIALLVPIAGNGLGLREWAIGLLAGVLPAFAGTEGTAMGLAGDLVHRGFELAAAILVGVPALLVLSRTLRDMTR